MNSSQQGDSGVRFTKHLTDSDWGELLRIMIRADKGSGACFAELVVELCRRKNRPTKGNLLTGEPKKLAIHAKNRVSTKSGGRLRLCDNGNGARVKQLPYSDRTWWFEKLTSTT